MLEIFEIYGWLFKAILVGLGFLILLIIVVGVVFVVGCAICGVLSNAEEIFEKGVGYPLAVLAFGSPILVPLFIYLASIYESLWFPWLAAISGIFGLFVYSVLIYTHFFEDKKKNKAKKDESSAEVAAKDKQFFRDARIESSVLQRLREDFVRKTSSFSASRKLSRQPRKNRQRRKHREVADE